MTTRRKPAGTRAGNHRSRRTPDGENGTAGTGIAALIDAIGKQNELLYEAATNASERSHRLSQAALNDIQSAQRDVIHLIQRWAESPFDLLGLYTGVVEAAVSARGRAAQSFARWRHELSQARTEAVETVQHSLQIGRQANHAGLAAARDLLVRRNGAS